MTSLSLSPSQVAQPAGDETLNRMNPNSATTEQQNVEKVDLSKELEEKSKEHQVGVTEDGKEVIMGRDRGGGDEEKGGELDFASFGDTGKQPQKEEETKQEQQNREDVAASPSSLNNTQKLDESTKQHNVLDDDEAVLEAKRRRT